MAKLVKCRTCGADISSSAKICPQCGAKNKKPIYKRWWFWVIIIMVIIGAGGNGSNRGEDESVKTSSSAQSENYTSASSPTKSKDQSYTVKTDFDSTEYTMM